MSEFLANELSLKNYLTAQIQSHLALLSDEACLSYEGSFSHSEQDCTGKDFLPASTVTMGISERICFWASMHTTSFLTLYRDDIGAAKFSSVVGIERKFGSALIDLLTMSWHNVDTGDVWCKLEIKPTYRKSVVETSAKVEPIPRLVGAGVGVRNDSAVGSPGVIWEKIRRA